MGKNLTRKILESHLAKPSAMNPGDEIYVKVDQTLCPAPRCRVLRRA